MTFPVIISTSKRIISLMMLAFLLQACGATKLAYNQSPELAYWYLDGYVDFSGNQSVQVKDELNNLQTWHRQNQLPSYIDTLQNMRQKMPVDVSAQDACTVWSDVRRKFMVLTDQAQPVVVSLVDTLTSTQLDTMARKFDKGNTQYRKDYLQPAKPVNQSKRYKQALSRAERLYGQLDDKQTTLIALQIEKSSFNAALAYAERQRRQQDTLQTLRNLIKTQPSSEQKNRAVRALFDRSFVSPNASYALYAEALTKESCANFANLHNTTSTSQRRKAIETLQGYEQDIKTLTNQSGS